MAMRMNHCSACRKHYFLTDARCPHCGAEAAGGPVARFVRQARMGGLLLFTALTTTACYGTPAYVADPNTLPPGVEEPKERVPSTIGTAYAFLRDGAGMSASQTYRLEAATIAGTVLTLKGVGGTVAITIEANAADAFTPMQGARPPLTLDGMKRLEAEASYPSGTGGERTLVTLKHPSSTATMDGTLQISRLDDAAIGGTLIVSDGTRQITLYFLAAR